MNELRNFVLRSIRLGGEGLLKHTIFSVSNFVLFDFVRCSKTGTLSAFFLLGIFLKE